MGKILRLEEVPLNEPLPDSLYDCDGVLIMRRGSILTSEKLKAIALKGLRYLELGAPAESGNAPAVATLEPAASASAEVREPWMDPAASESDDVSLDDIDEQSSIVPLNPSTALRVDQLVARAAATVEEIGRSLADGSLRDAMPIRSIAAEFLQEIHGDADQTLAAAMQRTTDHQLATRSVQLSILSIAVARAMKMTDTEQATVGTAAMLHDMALFELPESERYPHPGMRPESRRIYETHPAIAYDLLEKVRDIDGTIRIIVLQAHEQADGSGFPRRISITRTHRLARVVNLADAYLTLTGCGPNGQRILPADAIAYLMHQSCLGRFDSAATCGLVRALSLYPVGSMVLLSDDRTARVVRVEDRNPVSPVVAVTDENSKTRMIDLGSTDVTVVRPIDEEDTGRRRLPASELDKILW